MIYVDLPQEGAVRQLPFYLAMEEYLASRVQRGEEYFFMWQVNPTVIFGRNQILDNEVNVDYCRRNSIEMYRRRSGGGCVFANRDNIMMSYITADDSSVATTFERYTSLVAAMLRSLGLDASSTSRNDVLVDGMKVSGNAFYHTGRSSIVHGTMLYDTDMADMAAAITPSVAKRAAKGVESVRSRITTLRPRLGMEIEDFKDYARKYMTASAISLTNADVEVIEEIERPYHDSWWIMGKRPKSTLSVRRRIDGVGEFQVDIALDRNHCIEDMNITGDFFLLGDMDSAITGRVVGVPYDRAQIEDALWGIDPSKVIWGLSKENLLNIMFE